MLGLRAQREQLPRHRELAEVNRGKIVARLDWEERASSVAWSIEQGKKKGRPPTASQLEAIRSGAAVDEGVDAIAAAYAELATCRAYLATPRGIWHGPIPWSAMDQWCASHGIGADAAQHLCRTVAVVDGIMRKRLNAALKKGR